jgi:hypothetical protein
VVDTALATDTSFWTIDRLAERCGHYSWLERRLFEVTGRRASEPSSGLPGAATAEIRLFLSVLAARHAALAEQWRHRLPVRAGVDRQALIVPPPGPVPEALDLVGGAADLAGVLSGLVEEILPRLLDSYDQHLARSSSVAEGPVRALLEQSRPGGQREIEQGQTLLIRLGNDPAGAENSAELRTGFQRRLEGVTGVFPDVRAS